MKTNIMIDIETMGTSENAPIVSLGAVFFHSDGISSDQFYGVWTLQSVMEYGFVPEASTIMWWMDQRIESRIEIIKAKLPIYPELLRFEIWLEELMLITKGEKKDLRIWCNGANFDGVLLRYTIRKVLDKEAMWHQGQERCYRTIIKLLQEKHFDKLPTQHIALDDAVDQAIQLITILNKYDAWEE